MRWMSPGVRRLWKHSPFDRFAENAATVRPGVVVRLSYDTRAFCSCTCDGVSGYRFAALNFAARRFRSMGRQDIRSLCCMGRLSCIDIMGSGNGRSATVPTESCVPENERSRRYHLITSEPLNSPFWFSQLSTSSCTACCKRDMYKRTMHTFYSLGNAEFSHG